MAKTKTKVVRVELPEEPSANAYPGCPSGDTDYEVALQKWRDECNKRTLQAIPSGYRLVATKDEKKRVVSIIRTLSLEED